MRLGLFVLLSGLVWVVGVSGFGSALAEAKAPPAVAVPPSAQFYVLSFTEAPIAEVAEAVVGGALSRELSIDPAIDGTMSFSAEGAFTSEALLNEFGTAVLDQDVALMRSRAGALSLMPRSNMAAELARGSVLVALAPPGTGQPARLTQTAAAPIIYGTARWWEGPVGGLLIFLTGAASGAGALYAGQRLLRPAGPSGPALIRIAHERTVPDVPPKRDGMDDPELTIPHFESRPRER